MWTNLSIRRRFLFGLSSTNAARRDEIVKEGTKRMLQSAIDVEAFIVLRADRTDDRGRRYIVKNWSLSLLEQEVLTGVGGIRVTRGRVPSR